MQEEERRVSHMDEKRIGVNASFARTETIRGGGRQMGQLAEERRHKGGSHLVDR